MKKSHFQLLAFNRLRDKPKKPLSKNSNLEELGQHFPFLFKPNRVFAQHDQDIHRNAAQDRWLIQIKPTHNHLALPNCLVSLSSAGDFSLWYFQPPDSPAIISKNPASGLHRIDLKLREQDENAKLVRSFRLKNAQVSKRRRAKFELVRVTQQTDEDNWHYLRLETEYLQHIIILNLYSFNNPQQNSADKAEMKYSYRPHEKEEKKIKTYSFRQIGGWNGEQSYFWRDIDYQLKRGRFGNAWVMIENNDFNLQQAISKDKYFIAGGDNAALLYQENESQAEPYAIKSPLKNHISAVQILSPKITNERFPYFLVACEDSCLYILSKKNNELRCLQKVFVQGIIYSMAILGFKKGKWVDIALLCHNQGLLTGRLLFKQFDNQAGKKHNQYQQALLHETTWRAFFHKERDQLTLLNSDEREHLLNQVYQHCHIQKNVYHQLLLVSILLHDKSDKPSFISSVFERLKVWESLNDEVIDYLYHTIRRKIDNYIEHYNGKDNVIDHVMNILSYMFEQYTSCRVRIASRLLDGYIQGLRCYNSTAIFERELSLLHEFIHREVPHEKNYLLSTAQAISQTNHDPCHADEKTISLYFASYERLNTQKSFQRLTLPIAPHIGVIRAVCLINHPSHSHWTQLHLCSKSQTLYALKGKKNTAEQVIQDPDWQQRLFDDPQAITPALKTLATWDAQHALLLNQKQIGLAIKSASKVIWFDSRIETLHCLSIGKDAQQNKWVVVAGEWHRDLNSHEFKKTGAPLLDFFALNKQQLIQKPCHILPPEDKNRLEITQITWDVAGNLWGVTAGNGHLLRWLNPCGQTPCQTEVIKTLYASQYALFSWQQWVLTGGNDGVVRAFDLHGTLQWVFIGNSKVTGIQVLPQSDKENADIFVIIFEHTFITLLNTAGEQQHHLVLPNKQLIHLSIPAYRNQQTNEFLVASLEGEVFWTEMFDQNPYAYCQTYLQQRETPSQDLTTFTKLRESHLDLDTLTSWCYHTEVMREPSRAIWAARHLITEHQVFAPVITCLSQLLAHQRDGSTITFFRHNIFSLLGKHLAQLPENLDLDLRDLSCQSDDYVFAALLGNIPATDIETLFARHTWLLPSVIQYLKNQAVFTSSALLQLLKAEQTAAQDNKLLTEVFIAILQEDDNVKLHPSFIEGLLFLFFQGLDLSQGLVQALATTRHLYAALIDFLNDDNGERKKRHRFYQLIDQHAALLFSPEQYKTWEILYVYLQYDSTNKFNLDAFDAESLWREVKQAFSDTDNVEYRAFVTILGNLPEALPSMDEKSRAYLDSIRDDIAYENDDEISVIANIPIEKQDSELIDNLFPIAQSLKNTQYRIKYRRFVPSDMSLRLIQLKRELRAINYKQYFFMEVVYLLRLHWLIQIDVLRKRHIPASPKDYLDLIPPSSLFFVKGEATPLQLHFQNIGSKNLKAKVNITLDIDEQYHAEDTRFVLEGEYDLAPASEDHASGEIIFDTSLSIPEQQVIRASVHWQVSPLHEEAGTLNTRHLKLICRPRLAEFLQKYPLKDQQVKQLFCLKQDNQFTYQRIIVKTWTNGRKQFTQKTLVALIKHWAARCGRERELVFFSTESSGRNIVRLNHKLWQREFNKPPKYLEIWFVGDNIDWNLDFLTTVFKQSNTALLLPQLLIADKITDTALLDQILAPKTDFGLAILQWGLKAVIQNHIAVKANQYKPYFLTKKYHKIPNSYRGMPFSEVEWEKTTLETLSSIGMAQRNFLPALTMDACQPLGYLVPDFVMPLLAHLGLIKAWEQDYWLPVSSAVVDYVDQHFPYVEDDTPASIALQTRQLTMTQQMLFAERNKPIICLPYEKFSFAEWRKLRQPTAKPLSLFYRLLGLSNKKHYQKIQAEQAVWLKLFSAKKAARKKLIDYLSQAIEVKPLTALGDDAEHYQLTLRSERNTSSFHRLSLLIPRKNLLNEIRQGQAIDADFAKYVFIDLLKKYPVLQRHLCLIVYDLPKHLRDSTSSTIFLTQRQINRLCNTHLPLEEALIAIMQQQLLLGTLAHAVFQISSPVEGDKFFGRANELQHLLEGLSSYKSYVITGPRTIGKSSLLKKTLDLVQTQSRLSAYFPISIDLQKPNNSDNYAKFFAVVLSKLPSNILIPTDLNTKIHALDQELQKIARGKDIDNTLVLTQTSKIAETLLSFICQQVAPQIPLFLLDEADKFYQYDLNQGELLFTLFRAWNNQNSVKFVFSSYPPQANSMVGKMSDSRNQSYNFVEAIRLKPLELNESVELIMTGLRRVAVVVSEEDAIYIAQKALNVPNLLQHVCQNICEQLDDKIAQGLGNSVTKTVIDKAAFIASEGFMQVFFNHFNIDALKLSLFHLVVHQQYRFKLQQFIPIFQQYADFSYNDAKIKNHLDDLLHTLILTKVDNDYLFSGRDDRYYFPDIVLNVYHLDELAALIEAGT